MQINSQNNLTPVPNATNGKKIYEKVKMQVNKSALLILLATAGFTETGCVTTKPEKRTNYPPIVNYASASKDSKFNQEFESMKAKIKNLKEIAQEIWHLKKEIRRPEIDVLGVITADIGKAEQENKLTELQRSYIDNLQRTAEEYFKLFAGTYETIGDSLRDYRTPEHVALSELWKDLSESAPINTSTDTRAALIKGEPGLNIAGTKLNILLPETPTQNIVDFSDVLNIRIARVPDQENRPNGIGEYKNSAEEEHESINKDLLKLDKLVRLGQGNLDDGYFSEIQFLFNNIYSRYVKAQRNSDSEYHTQELEASKQKLINSAEKIKAQTSAHHPIPIKVTGEGDEIQFSIEGADMEFEHAMQKAEQALEKAIAAKSKIKDEFDFDQIRETMHNGISPTLSSLPEILDLVLQKQAGASYTVYNPTRRQSERIFNLMTGLDRVLNSRSQDGLKIIFLENGGLQMSDFHTSVGNGVYNVHSYLKKKTN